MPGISGEDSFTPNQIENPKTQQAECKRPWNSLISVEEIN